MSQQRNTARFKLPYFSCCNRKIERLNDKYVLVAFGWHVILRKPEQAKIRSEETAQKHICQRLHCLHFNSSNSNKQYNWLLIVLLLFKQTMTPGTRDPTKYIRQGEERVRTSDLRLSENQANFSRA